MQPAIRQPRRFSSNRITFCACCALAVCEQHKCCQRGIAQVTVKCAGRVQGSRRDTERLLCSCCLLCDQAVAFSSVDRPNSCGKPAAFWHVASAAPQCWLSGSNFAKSRLLQRSACIGGRLQIWGFLSGGRLASTPATTKQGHSGLAMQHTARAAICERSPFEAIKWCCGFPPRLRDQSSLPNPIESQLPTDGEVWCNN